MATCEICGTDFDDRGVQIVLPGLEKSFDKIDCAVRARNLAGSASGAVPMRGMLVPLAGAGTRSFALGGLSAGLAAALAGTRARVALGGATVGVALLAATTAHLATRGDGGTEATVRPQALAPPARYAGDSDDRVRASSVASTASTSSVATTAAEKRSAPEVRYTLLAASRSTDVPRAARVMTVSTRTRTHALKTVRHARHAASGKTATASSGSGHSSSRSGWGHGDKNHSHGGPSKHKSGGSSKQTKQHKGNGHNKK